MDKSTRTNPLSYHSTVLFPRDNKIQRASLESQPCPRWD